MSNDTLEIGNPEVLDKAAPVQHDHPMKKVVEHISILELKPYFELRSLRLTRRRYTKTPVREYLSTIQPTELAQKYLAFYDTYPALKTVCAGAKHHHWWKGGLEDHMSEMIGFAWDMMELYPGDFSFTKDDVVIAVFLHDFGKIWTYREITPEDRSKTPYRFKANQVFTYNEGVGTILDDESKILLTLARHGIVPTDIQWSAVLFAEGGYSDANFGFKGPTYTSNTVNSANHLAPFVHMLDIYSATLLGRSIA